MMKIKKNKAHLNSDPFTHNKYSLSLLAILLISQFSVNAVLADDTSEQLKENTDKKILVTGTRIKKIDIDNISPILSISREDIDKFGYATVKDVIDGLTQNTGGTIDNSFTSGFTPGASSVNLRGIGFGHTLVLIDGRRLPIYPISIGGTSNFVDLSSIPVGFIERIDVLTDGASAVYGSDAVSGVINVITRQEIEGISLNYRLSDTSDGGLKSQRFNLLTGARNGDTQIDLILDYWSQDALWATDRNYAASDVANPRGSYSAGGVSFYGTETGNIYQHPNCGTANDPIAGQSIPNVEVSLTNIGQSWCGFDRSAYRQLIAPQDRISFMTRLNYEFNPNISFFSRIGYSNTQTDVQSEPNFYGGALFNGYGYSIINNGGILPAGAPNNPTTGSSFEEEGVFVRRLVEFGPRKSKVENNSSNFLVGLKGSFSHGKYDWEAAYSFNKTKLDVDSNNILLSGLNAEVDNGLDLFQTIPQEVVNAFSYDANQDSYSSNRVLDFSISGDLSLELNAGPVQFASAIELVSEQYQDRPDSLVLLGDAFDGVSSGEGKREHLGIGGELSFPFSENFNLDIALRWDDYDDASSVNSAFSPRIAMSFHPAENILTRFSWGKSFRAPDMQRLFGGESYGYTDILDPEFQLDANGDFCPEPQNDPSCRPSLIQSVQLITLANIDLAEEEGTNMNLGLIWEISKDLSFTMDYFKIELEELVTAPSPQLIVNICSELDELCDLVARDEFGSLASSDSYIATFAINFAEQNTDGIDLTVNYSWQNTLGEWSSSLSSTWVRSFETKISAESDGVDSINLGQLPEFRHNLMLDWHKDVWGASLRINYIDNMTGYYCASCNSSEMIKSWATINTSLRYHYSDYTRIRLGINNLTNEKPPEDPTQTTWPFFANDGGYYSSVGREFYLQLETSI